LDGNISADPLFADRAGGDYRLTHLSPAVDAGDSAAGAAARDLLGSPRILGAAVDLGAYELPQPWLDALRALRITGGLEAAGPADMGGGASSERISLETVTALVRRAAGLDP
jgi:hypothetical protein